MERHKDHRQREVTEKERKRKTETEITDKERKRKTETKRDQRHREKEKERGMKRESHHMLVIISVSIRSFFNGVSKKGRCIQKIKLK